MRMLTLNWKSFAAGVMTSISVAVDALCSCLGPGRANETLPMSTLWTTVLARRT